MRLISVAFCAGLIAATLGTIPRADATTVKHFDLKGITGSAARVFRGTVTDVRPGSVKVGGGQLATTVYRIRVIESFKGEFATFKDITYADVEMIGSVKAESQKGGARHFSAFRDMPRLSSETITCCSSPPRAASRCRVRSDSRRVASISIRRSPVNRRPTG